MRIHSVVALAAIVLAGCATASSTGSGTPAGSVHTAAGIQVQAAPAAGSQLRITTAGQARPATSAPPMTVGHATGLGSSTPQSPTTQASAAPNEPAATGPRPGPKCLTRPHLGIPCTLP
ncbi:MAG TPA: hypothetical protein VET65_08475 [Candidatus Limnocylindrales bacterium]|nr:hypothetical protein [Candidatus Limnocylindrales bacterium]